MVAVEIAVQDAAGVRVALEEGADRIELCVALGLGGLTPSIGLVEATVDAARSFDKDGFVHVLVRPRGGDFVYDSDELETSVRDVRRAVDTGADGVVIGALTENGEADLAAVRALVDAAGAADVTFHRALDAASDPEPALDALMGAGVRRVLTSGGEPRSIDGVRRLRRFVERVDGRIQVMAGGGVRVDDIPELIATGVDAVHLSARATATGGVSGPGGGTAGYDVTDRSMVQAAVRAAAGTA